MQFINEQTYKAFGLTISSEISLPELTQLEVDPNNTTDVAIKYKLKTEYKLWNEQQIFKINKNIVVFKFRDVAIFEIREGKRIYVTPLEEFDIEVCQLFILGTCMGALLMQRKMLPLHGSAVAINGRAYAIVGESGAGKSTLARCFISRGFKLLTDDVIAISYKHNDTNPLVFPSYPQQKLWDDSLENFGIENSNYQSLFGRINKYYVPVSNNYCEEPLPLAGVFELERYEEECINLQPLGRLQSLDTLFRHTYRNFFIPELGLTDWHFQTSAQIANHIDMYHLYRPKTGFTADKLVNIILNQLEMEVTM